MVGSVENTLDLGPRAMRVFYDDAAFMFVMEPRASRWDTSIGTSSRNE